MRVNVLETDGQAGIKQTLQFCSFSCMHNIMYGVWFQEKIAKILVQ